MDIAPETYLPVRWIQVRRRIVRTVDNIKRFTCICQWNNQRMIAPFSIVGDIHTFFTLEFQVFRKFGQIQGGKKFWPQVYSPYSEDQNFLSNMEVGRINKNLNLELHCPAVGLMVPSTLITVCLRDDVIFIDFTLFSKLRFLVLFAIFFLLSASFLEIFYFIRNALFAYFCFFEENLNTLF